MENEICCSTIKFTKIMEIRNFTTEEQNIIKQIIGFKLKGNLQELQFARFLRKQVNFFAIEWNISKLSMTIFHEHSYTEESDRRMFWL